MGGLNLCILIGGKALNAENPIKVGFQAPGREEVRQD